MDITPLLSTIAAPLVGAWAGARLALVRFVRERAFDRRLDWHEQTVWAVHTLGLRVHEAAERERSGVPEDVVKAYDALAPLLLVSELYGQSNSIRVTERIASRMSEAARQTDVVEYYSEMSRELRWAAAQIAGECRSHLGLKRLKDTDLSAARGLLPGPAPFRAPEGK